MAESNQLICYFPSCPSILAECRVREKEGGDMFQCSNNSHVPCPPQHPNYRPLCPVKHLQPSSRVAARCSLPTRPAQYANVTDTVPRTTHILHRTQSGPICLQYLKFGLYMLRRRLKNLTRSLRICCASTLCSFIQPLLNQLNDKFQL